jgi:hypothetical protein
VSRDNTNTLTHVLINHIGPNTGTIDGVDLDLDIEDSGAPQPAVRFVTYTASGGSETSATLGNVVTNVSICGNVGSSSNTISCPANYTTAGRLNIEGPGLFIDGALPSKFIFSNFGPYVPTWTATVTNPSLGNGALSGSYSIHDGLCFVNIQLNMGSTTTYGSGSWNFTLPFTARVPSVGSVRALDSGSAWFTGVCNASSTVLDATFNNTGNQMAATIPFTWANGDKMQLNFSYEVA